MQGNVHLILSSTFSTFRIVYSFDPIWPFYLQRLDQGWSLAQKKDKDRRKGKGRRFCLGRGEEFIIFLNVPAVFSRTILKNWMHSSFYFKSSWYNSSDYYKSSQAKQLQRGKELNNKFFPPNRSDDLCLFFYLYQSSMVGGYARGEIFGAWDFDLQYISGLILQKGRILKTDKVTS